MTRPIANARKPKYLTQTVKLSPGRQESKRMSGSQKFAVQGPEWDLVDFFLGAVPRKLFLGCRTYILLTKMGVAPMLVEENLFTREYFYEYFQR